MFCSRCSTHLADGLVFCTNCGLPQTETPTIIVPSSSKTRVNKFKTLNTVLATVAAMLGVGVLAAVLLLGRGCGPLQSNTPSQVLPTATPPASSVRTNETTEIEKRQRAAEQATMDASIRQTMNEQQQQQQPPPSRRRPFRIFGARPIELPPNGADSIEFHVPAAGGTVSGNIQARGGVGNDIVCAIVDAANLYNFKAGRSYNGYYHSGQVQVANVYAELSEGTYYLALRSPTPWTTRIVYGRVVLEPK